MSSSPKANRSFLYRNNGSAGDRRTSLQSERVVYATIDKLAMGRASLPLQLPPFQHQSAIEKVPDSNSDSCTNCQVNQEQSNLQAKSSTIVLEKTKSDLDSVVELKKESRIGNFQNFQTSNINDRNSVNQTLVINSRKNFSKDCNESINSKDANNLNSVKAIVKDGNDVKDTKCTRSIKEIKEKLIESSRNFSNRIHCSEKSFTSDKSRSANYFYNKKNSQTGLNGDSIVSSLYPSRTASLDRNNEKTSQNFERFKQNSQEYISKVSEDDLKIAKLSLRTPEKKTEDLGDLSAKVSRSESVQISRGYAEKSLRERKNIFEALKCPLRNIVDRNLPKESENCLHSEVRDEVVADNADILKCSSQVAVKEPAESFQQITSRISEMVENCVKNFEGEIGKSEENIENPKKNAEQKEKEEVFEIIEHLDNYGNPINSTSTTDSSGLAELEVSTSSTKNSTGITDSLGFVGLENSASSAKNSTSINDSSGFADLENSASFVKHCNFMDPANLDINRERNDEVPSEESFVVIEEAREVSTWDNCVIRRRRKKKKKSEKRVAESETSLSSLGNDGSDICNSKKKRHFARNVLHYVPGHLVKRPKKLKRKYKSSSSLTAGRSAQPETSLTSNFERSTSLSREELKYVTISSPTNFVHVASATNLRLQADGNYVGSNLEQTVVITHEQKCATLPLLVGRQMYSLNQNKRGDKFGGNSREGSTDKTDRTTYVQIIQDSTRSRLINTREITKIDKSNDSVGSKDENQQIYEPMCQFTSLEQNEPLANSSFLWSNRVQNLEKNGSYDDIVSPDFSSEEHYDDIGSPVSSENEVTPDDEIYDDIMVPANEDSQPNHQTPPQIPSKPGGNVIDNSRREQSNEENSFEKTLFKKTLCAMESNNEYYSEDQYLVVNNEYSSVEDEDGVSDGGDNVDDLVYDDVEFPSEERVNSLYAGSTLKSTLTNSKESEWEDLEDSPSLARRNAARGKKKSGQQRWSRKARKQRSKRSKKNSRASTKAVRDSSLYDAVSEDSNYETLNSTSPDTSSTCSESPVTHIERPEVVPEEKLSNFTNYIEAPTKPMPPPPREVSLTQTIGKRMKMLRRTWSITKGSLGRIRRRTSVEDENVEEKDNNSEHHSIDSKKYFSFKKHFRKNLTSLSTFYLYDESLYGDSGTKNSDKKESAYSNNNWYNQRISEKENIADPLRPDEAAVNNDNYSALTEEPLYQFYAAAAARDAFEFDSDGYEEVESVNSFSASIDLARPGHRTLWCQTPQVISSGLLKRLANEEKKVQEAKFEIITSEASYLNSLHVLQNEFLNNSELVNDILTVTEREKLFGGVPSILAESERFLSELETVWKEDLLLYTLPDVLLKYAERCLDIYVSYCSNQVTIDIALKELRTRKGHKFLDMISQIETRPACQSLSLHSFLMLPMQRITRLPLLADAVLSKLSIEHEERPLWEKVLSNFSYIVAECNEGARLASQIAEMESLAKKLEYPSKIKQVPLTDRCLVRSGPLVQLSSKADIEYKLTFGKRFQKVPLYLLLLTDYILVTKLKHNTHEDTYSVIDTCKRNLLTLEPVGEDSPFAGRNAMILTLLENHAGRQTEYVLMCDSTTERERWLKAVSPPNPGLVGETLYETWDCPQVMALYSYSPAQPDELSLQPGDTINVLRKMADGWYHGEKLLHGEQGWFPGNYTKEVASEHVRAKNLKQRHRLLALSHRVLQRKGKSSIAIR
ncbi:uncharacterized protein Exn [Prorops nasuta]|uniref:uncharacterized protein Exn n=1 Tax=Prorops nasuta TaxID=863751 RepID=UPI0034CFE3AB